MIVRANYFDVLNYLDYQQKYYQSNPQTIDRKWAHLRHFIEWADDVPFQVVEPKEPTFPVYLLSARNDGKGKQLSPASMQRACGEARNFITWAKINKPSKYKSIPERWIGTIRPSRRSGVHSKLVEREYYSLDEVRELCSFQPQILIDKRDRAAIAFLFLSGMRIGAFCSIPVSCVDLENLTIEQSPSEGVRTKNNKAARTYLLPINDLLEVVTGWDRYVRKQLGEKAYWYPVVNQDGTEWGNLENPGSLDSRRQSFARGLKKICKVVDVPYKSPHKLRNGHGVYGVKQAKTIEQFKAFSQNMMHESMEITDRLYGKLAGDDVKFAISRIGREINNIPADNKELFEKFLKFNEWLNGEDG